MDGLYDGRYRPGQRLHEAQLTARYQVSRGPVREALNALAAIGIVDLTLQRGAQIRAMDLSEAIDTLVVASSLIGLSARLAAEHHQNDVARDRLIAAMTALSRFSPDSTGADYALAREHLYGAINAMAGNIELSRLLPTVRIHLIRVQFGSLLRGTNQTRHQDYRRIVDAILQGKSRAAETAVHTHLGRAIDGLSRVRS